jgi:hypothetical protein
VNPHYIGLTEDGPNPMDYYTSVKLPGAAPGPGEYVLLNESSDFVVTFMTKSEEVRSKQVVHCDAKQCVCEVKRAATGGSALEPLDR